MNETGFPPKEKSFQKPQPEDQSASVAPWYKDGLRFTCQRCGRCCSGPSGLVEASYGEARAMAQELGMEWEEFLEQAALEYEGSFFMKEVRCRHGFDCILLDRFKKDGHEITGCMARNSRPIQCRTWPFWPEVITSPQTWKLFRKRCPGIGVGELHPLEEIEAKAAQTHDPTAAPPRMLLRGYRLRMFSGSVQD